MSICCISKTAGRSPHFLLFFLCLLSFLAEKMNKDRAAFPIGNRFIYLNHCGISPLYSGAASASSAFLHSHSLQGAAALEDYHSILDRLRRSVARFIGTSAENISLMRNTAEALSMIAAAYPFEKGDQIISYIHEYPSNYYPWELQRKRGVELVLLSDQPLQPLQPGLARGRSSKLSGKLSGRQLGLGRQSRKRGHSSAQCFGSWSFEELEASITARTRMIALSHVQFTSGFAADLKRLGALARRENILLVVDAAQSLGSLPIRSDEWGIDAIATSGWKWLLGPLGSGLLYTSPRLRKELGYTMAGADLMRQGQNYLDHSWQPYQDGRRFEYSTAAISQAAALQACFDEIFNHYGIDAIYAEIQRLQRLLLARLDHRRFHLRGYENGYGGDENLQEQGGYGGPAPENCSAILSFTMDEEPGQFAERAIDKGVYISSRGGYLRIAPHFYNTDQEIEKAVDLLNSL